MGLNVLYFTVVWQKGDGGDGGGECLSGSNNDVRWIKCGGLGRRFVTHVDATLERFLP